MKGTSLRDRTPRHGDSLGLLNNRSGPGGGKAMIHFTRQISLFFLFVLGAVTLARAQGVPSGGTWRQPALQKYDRDRDGRLSDAERERMRKEVFAQRRGSSGRGRGAMFPPELVTLYDKDGDGTLDDREAETAQKEVMKMFQNLQKNYDTNGNGRFETAEVEKLRSDAAVGKLKDIPRIIIQAASQQGRRPRPVGPRTSAGVGGEINLREIDRDGDGRLNEAELRAARARLQEAGGPPEQP